MLMPTVMCAQGRRYTKYELWIGVAITEHVVIMIKALIAMAAADEPAYVVDAKRDQLLELQELQSVHFLPQTVLSSLLAAQQRFCLCSSIYLCSNVVGTHWSVHYRSFEKEAQKLLGGTTSLARSLSTSSDHEVLASALASGGEKDEPLATEDVELAPLCA
eukprot:COSAG02_NODE_1335_length_13197_cov_5.830279_3_plen_161_part_00